MCSLVLICSWIASKFFRIAFVLLLDDLRRVINPKIFSYNGFKLGKSLRFMLDISVSNFCLSDTPALAGFLAVLGLVGAFGGDCLGDWMGGAFGAFGVLGGVLGLGGDNRGLIGGNFCGNRCALWISCIRAPILVISFWPSAIFLFKFAELDWVSSRLNLPSSIPSLSRLFRFWIVDLSVSFFVVMFSIAALILVLNSW